MKTIYTTGYSKKSHSEMYEIMRKYNALLVDIRFKPYSQNPLWRKERLEQVFGGSYLHIREFGNRNYKGGETDIVDLETGIQMLNYITSNVILMCVCHNPVTCHRSYIAEKLRESGFNVVELDSPQPIQGNLL